MTPNLSRAARRGATLSRASYLNRLARWTPRGRPYRAQPGDLDHLYYEISKRFREMLDRRRAVRPMSDLPGRLERPKTRLLARPASTKVCLAYRASQLPPFNSDKSVSIKRKAF